MTALLVPGETLTLGVNVIVRPGDREGCQTCVNLADHWFVAPQDWVALTGPCPTCSGEGILGINLEPPDQGIHWCDSPDCRDGRRLTDFGNGVKAIVVSVEPEPDGRNWRITLEVPE